MYEPKVSFFQFHVILNRQKFQINETQFRNIA